MVGMDAGSTALSFLLSSIKRLVIVNFSSISSFENIEGMSNGGSFPVISHLTISLYPVLESTNLTKL